jgi:hypothetical protein
MPSIIKCMLADSQLSLSKERVASLPTSLLSEPHFPLHKGVSFLF